MSLSPDTRKIAAFRKLDRTQYLDGGFGLRFSIREKEIQLEFRFLFSVKL